MEVSTLSVLFEITKLAMPLSSSRLCHWNEPIGICSATLVVAGAGGVEV